MTYELTDKELFVKRPDDSIEMKMFHGTTRALIHNMVKGVSEGFEKVLEIQGIGYRAQMRGDKLVLNIGHSHEDVVEPVEGIKLEATSATEIHVSGIDAQKSVKSLLTSEDLENQNHIMVKVLDTRVSTYSSDYPPLRRAVNKERKS